MMNDVTGTCRWRNGVSRISTFWFVIRKIIAIRCINLQQSCPIYHHRLSTCTRKQYWTPWPDVLPTDPDGGTAPNPLLWLAQSAGRGTVPQIFRARRTATGWNLWIIFVGKYRIVLKAKRYYGIIIIFTCQRPCKRSIHCFVQLSSTEEINYDNNMHSKQSVRKSHGNKIITIVVRARLVISRGWAIFARKIFR